jgi:hypothetical protein
MIVHWMLEMWVSGGLGTHEHKRDTTVYPSLGYRGPMSSNEVFFVFMSTQIGGLQVSLVGDHSMLSYDSSMVRFLPL